MTPDQIVLEIQCRLTGHVGDFTDEHGRNYAWDVLRCENCGQKIFRGELDGRIDRGFSDVNSFLYS